MSDDKKPRTLTFEQLTALAAQHEQEEAARRRTRFIDLGEGELLDLSVTEPKGEA